MTLRIPTATYRLQLHAGFGFRDAAKIAGYLARLGISDLYLSPPFKAAPGSTHGYDVLDHGSLNPELGGAEGFQVLAEAARAHDLGLVVDFVPNHMGVGCDGNRMWEDVLEHGQASEFADYFDIDWQPPKETLAHKLLLPILPDQYGVSLESGLFNLHFDKTSIRLRVGARTLPLRPQSLGMVLNRVADLIEDQVPLARAEELRRIASDFSKLDEGEPSRASEADAYRVDARLAQQQLCEFVALSGLEDALEQALGVLGGSPSEPLSFDFLDRLLRAQAYRLSSWQLALEAVNYRRFFDQTDLASVRVELPAVFETCHKTLLALVERGQISGIRLDHIDGLFDPIGYLRQLEERLHRVLPDSDGAQLPAYVVVEKILAPGEQLPASFRAHGTTGYEFARIATGVLIDRRAESGLSDAYRQFTGDSLSFEEHVVLAKRDVLGSLLASDAAMLSRALERLAEQDRRWRDLTWHSLHGALIEVMAACSAYRSYVRPDGTRSAEDLSLINQAVATAMHRNPTAGRGAYQFLRSLLVLDNQLPGAREFAMRFQQTTGPAMAKALEDTVFYRYSRSLAENEVGSRPDRIGVEMAEFHAQNAIEENEHRGSMIATSTHDTKRGEDARARLAVLSEMPVTWRQAAHELRAIAVKHCTVERGAQVPARGDQYLYYQALVGVLPFGITQDAVSELKPRLEQYMLKACREAKVHSSWLHPDAEYEAALQRFVAGTLDDPIFVARLLRFCRKIEVPAACKALAQLTLKLCSPGVPDTYQGSEVWHQVLVDPDNRRPVDYSALAAQLAELDEQRAESRPVLSELRDDFADGRLKLFVLSELLRLRRAQPELFRTGYFPLDAGQNCVAFGRGPGGCDLVCAVTRFPSRVSRGRAHWPLGARWGEQSLSNARLTGEYRNVLTGERLELTGSVRLAELFSELPVAVLVADLGHGH